ncbi:hypothetical protein GCM10028777_15650 [Angustibacter speluncae]
MHVRALSPVAPAAASRRRDRWRGSLPRWEPLAWQSVSLGLGCPVILLVLLDAGVFRPERALWVQLCCLSFLAFAALALATGRVGRVSLWAQCVEALVMVPVLGTSTDHLGVLAACAVTVVLVLVSAAAYLPAREVVALTAAGGVAFGVLMVGQGYGGTGLALTVTAVVLLSGVPAAILFTFRTRAEAAVEHARTMSRTDALTGLLNRRGLAEAARDLVAGARADTAAIGVLVVDVDRFKQVNDVHGHVAGDRVLQQVAAAVRDACRPGDVVARLGGEELCVLLRCDDPGTLLVVGERLRAAVEEAPTRPSVTVSVGGACASPVPVVVGDGHPDGAQDLVLRLVDRADAALYEVKRAGRNGVRVHGDRGRPAATMAG